MTTFTFCWLSFLTCRSFQLEAAPVMTADTMRQLMASQEVRGRRQLGSGQRIIEDEIVVRHSGSTTGSDRAQDAPLANPDRLWPSGVVEYKFYHTFPVENRRIVQESMTYISTKVSVSGDCITFQEA